MTIGTTRFFQNNSELFSRLNEDLKLLQSQAGSGKADLKLSKNYPSPLGADSILRRSPPVPVWVRSGLDHYLPRCSASQWAAWR